MLAACLVGIALAGAAAAAGCVDPVQRDAKDALGPEDPNVRTGPLHRPGQPCLVCHDNFTVAGTLYLTPKPDAGPNKPLAYGRVRITDATGAKYEKVANCVGNFYITPREFDPVFPFRVDVAFGADPKEEEGTLVAMESLVHRDGSCASCHKDPPGPASVGQIFLTDLPNPPAVQSCEGVTQ